MITQSPHRPRPPPKSADEVGKIRLRNRRREWLERNPKYVDNLEHEFADLLLYDELVRHYQTPAEQQADAKTKGYSRLIESDLMRGEAKLAKLSSSIPVPITIATSTPDQLDISPPIDRAEALERWQDFLRRRFVRGDDEDFDYRVVDEEDEFDVLERKDREEEWFDQEEPGWVGRGDDGGYDGGYDGDEGGGGGRQKQDRDRMVLDSETGVQDF